jgi:hypothetical protein
LPLFIHSFDDAKEGSRQEIFWKLKDEHGRAYFFQSDLLKAMERVMDEYGKFEGMSDTERRDKIKKVWDIGRRGKERRGFFDKSCFDQFEEPVLYAIGSEEPTWDDVRNLPVPQPELTELQAKLKAMFNGLKGFVRRIDNDMPWEHYDLENDDLVRHLVDNKLVTEGKNKAGVLLTAEEWAVEMIKLAQDVLSELALALCHCPKLLAMVAPSTVPRLGH